LLASAKEQHSSVLLHYLGHGYHKRGVPFWLYRGIKSWLAEQTGASVDNHRQFSTVFHDLWPSSVKPWKSEFYWRKPQQWLVERLHRRSKMSITSTRRMRTLLEIIQPHKTLWLPIPSNVAMSAQPKSSHEPDARLRVAIFGRQGSRAATIKAHTNLLRTLDEKNLLGSAMLLGQGLNATRPLTNDVTLLQKCVSRKRIEILGESSPDNISASFGRADLFLSHHGGEHACESGAFMAALAARCPAVLRDGTNAAPLRESEHFIASDDSQPSVKRFEQITADGHLDRIATAGRLWYEQNADWKVIARKYQEAICREPSHSKASAKFAETPMEPVQAWTPPIICSKPSII
jgi:hypothetical protein